VTPRIARTPNGWIVPIEPLARSPLYSTPDRRARVRI
jgi:hypothetical protein